MDRNEEETLLRIADGDLVELEILCRRHTTKLFNFAYRLTGDWKRAEETAQETLFRVFKLILDGEFKEEPDVFRPSMYRIVRNLCMDRINERQVGAVSEGEPATSGDVGATLSHLNYDHRNALMLRDYSGLTYAEIARVLDCSTKQVKMLVYQARQHTMEVLRGGE